MIGQNKIVCIAGKNQCSIDFVNYISSIIPKKNILILPNKNDDGIDNWQPSFKKYAKKKNYKIITIDNIYNIENLIFISIEYESIIDINKFKSKKLYNFHFSLLPKYRGCHTNFFQIYNGEKISGITLHKIDNGIDTGPIIDKLKFKISKNSNAYQNYLNLMQNSVKLLKKNLKNLIIGSYNSKKQLLNKGSYYSRSSINYQKMKFFNLKKISLKDFNKIKAFIFPPLQLPIVNNKKLKSIIYINKKYKCIYD
jgi:methionyl-tRNA formyltransferase